MRKQRSRRLTPSSPSLTSQMEWQSSPQPEVMQRQEDQLEVMTSMRNGPGLQAQLERADRLGHHFEQVPVLSASPQIMGKRASGEAFVQRVEETSEQTPTVMPETETGQDPAAGADLEHQLSANQGGGSPLPEQTRQFMEPRFGADFSGVRIHTGTEAVQMNRSLNAQAFTHGSDIFFNSGRFDPGSMEGKQLLAHELTHVLQQQGTHQISTKAMGDQALPQPQQQDGSGPEHLPQDQQDPEAKQKETEAKPKQQQPTEPQDEIDRVALEYLPPREEFMKEDLHGLYNDTSNIRGEESDCYELAKMMATARKYPEEIKKNTQDNYDGTYNVRIFVRDINSDRKQPLTLMVDGILPVGQPGQDFFFQEQKVSPPEPELWSMLVEKAYAMHMRGQGQVEGGNIARSLQMLTSMTEYPVDRFSDAQISSMINYLVNNKAHVNATSRSFQGKTQSLQDEASRFGLPVNPRSHFMIDRANGELFFIQNPAGFKIELNLARFKRLFSSFRAR